MKIFKAIILSAVLAALSGCAVLGMSIRGLEQEKHRHVKVFAKDISYCYQKSLDAFNEWNASVFMKSDNEYIIAMRMNNVFNSCINTTEVGIFFKKLEDGVTQVDVASFNYDLGQFTAEYLFKYIEHPEEKTCPIIEDKPFKI